MVSFTGSTRPASSSPRPQRTRSSAWRRNWAASPPTSSFPMRTLPAVPQGRRRLLRQLRPVLPRADAHAGAAPRRQDEALAIAKTAAETQGRRPARRRPKLGPVVSQVQFDKIQGLIESGIKEGATLVTGGRAGRKHLNRGYYVRPTVFGHVTPA